MTIDTIAYMSDQALPLFPKDAKFMKPKDPSPSVDRIDQLAQRILDGDILLPKFQRAFVWDKGQIIKLLDSVRRGYPIGSILLWQSGQELKSENCIADLQIKAPKYNYPVNYLLDGQQRLSTICGALFWSGTDPNSQWNIAYDLRKEMFFHLNTLDDPPLHNIRMNKLQDPSAYFGHLGSLTTPDKELLNERGKELFNRFKDYKVAAVTLNDMPIADVAPIFERINSTGVRLTVVDLMRAATWSPEFDLVDAIDEVLFELTSKNFGALDRKVILRNLSAASGGGFSVESIDGLRHNDAAKLKTAIKATEEAYKRAVDFLSTQVRVANIDVLPYKNQLTILAEVFRLIPTPDVDQYAAIRRWFWRTAFSGYFGGWNTGSMASDQKRVAEFAAGKTSDIEVPLPKPKQEIWETRTFRSNNAHAKLLAIVLAERQPRDLLTGQLIDTGTALAWNNAKEFHHFFPRKFLEKTKVSPNKINCLANFVILSSSSNKSISDTKPSDYLKKVSEQLGNHLEDVLSSNLISATAYEAALKDDFDKFLEARAATIQYVVAQHAAWSDNVVPIATDLATYEIQENDEDVI